MIHKGTFMGLSGQFPKKVMALHEDEAIDCGGWTWHRVDRETLARYPAGEPKSPRKVIIDRRIEAIKEAVEAQDQAEFDAENDEL